MPRANTPAQRYVHQFLKAHARPGLPRGQALAYHQGLMREAWRQARAVYGRGQANPLNRRETGLVRAMVRRVKSEARGLRKKGEGLEARFLDGAGTAYADVVRTYGERNPLTACPVCRNPVAVPDGADVVDCGSCGAVLGVRG